MSNTTKHHRHVVVGTLNIQVGDDMLGETTLNAVLKTDSRELRGKDLADAQKALQMVHIDRTKRMGGDPSSMTVLDVTLLNVLYLGHQTDAEFHGELNKDKPTTEEPAKPSLSVVKNEAHPNDPYADRS